MQPTEIVKPSVAQQRWHDMELGMFFHFDIPIYKEGWQSWAELLNGLPAPDLYQPAALDTDQWMEAAKAMGAKYAVFAARHRSGFLQWQSDLYPYGVKQSSWRGGKGDVVADFVESCRKYDIKPGLYATVASNVFLGVDNPGLVNGGKGGDEAKQRQYVEICERMVEELWSRYGELYEVWFDGGAIPVEDGGPDLIPILERHQPNAIVFQGPPGTPNMVRYVGNERGVAPYPCWSTIDAITAEGGTVEKTFGGSPESPLWIPGECDVPVRNHEWFWRPDEEHKLYSRDDLVEMYYSSVGRNCNLLLNANPNRDGLVPEADLQRYVQFGDEIRRRFSSAFAATQGEGEVVELAFKEPKSLNHVEVMEDISLGERVIEYVVERQAEGGRWDALCAGSCVGHKRIERFDTVKTRAIRLRMTGAKATPHIRRLAAYLIE